MRPFRYVTALSQFIVPPWISVRLALCCVCLFIPIHAPCGGSDIVLVSIASVYSLFQPTLPVGGVTASKRAQFSLCHFRMRLISSVNLCTETLRCFLLLSKHSIQRNHSFCNMNPLFSVVFYYEFCNNANFNSRSPCGSDCRSCRQSRGKFRANRQRFSGPQCSAAS